MVTTDIFLKMYLKQVEKAHSILKFVYDFKKRKAILKKIKEAIFAKYEGGNILTLYMMFRKNNEDTGNKKMSFFELIKKAQEKLKGT